MVQRYYFYLTFVQPTVFASSFLDTCQGHIGKGLIQGTSQYVAKKMRTVKVHLKAGYQVLLYQKEN